MLPVIAPETNRPYPPPSNVTAVLGRLRSRNLPERVDGEYLRDAGIPDGTNSRTLFALRFLGLVDGDLPSAALRSIAVSTDEEYQAILSGLVRDAYSEVFEVIDPTQDAQDRIINFFRRYTPASQRGRMVVFFLGMCREAGIATLDAPRQRTSGASQGRTSQRQSPARTPRRESRPSRSEDESVGGLGQMDPALQMLVRSLPPVGSPLPEDKRKQWLEMAGATLSFLYPTDAPEPEEQNTDEGEEVDTEV